MRKHHGPTPFFWILPGLWLLTAGCESLALAPVGSGSGPFVFEDDERRLWKRSREEQERLDKGGVLYEDPSLVEYLNQVAQRVLPDSIKQAGLSVEIRIIKHAALNAFAFPNGVIYVHTGILARMDNEAQLATLLAHELTHVTHRHAVQRFRDLQNKTAFFATLQVLTVPFGIYGTGASLLGFVGTLAAVYGYSQEQEAEADREGLTLTVKAGYDPRESPVLFLHLKQWVEDEKKPEPFFFATHPRLTERIASYEELLRGQFKTVVEENAARGKEQFLVKTRRLLLDNSVLDLQGGRFLQAQKGLRKFLAQTPDDPRAHYFLAESYRRQNDPKQWPEAIRLYQSTLSLDPTFPDPHRGLGTLYYQEGKVADAARAFERYLELAPAAKDRAYIEDLLREVRK